MDFTMHRKRSRSLLGIMLIAFLVSETSATGTSEPDCSSLVDFKAEVPSYAVIATGRGICGGDLTCCTPEMEKELMWTMESYFIDSLQSNVKKLSKVLDNSYHRLVKRFADQMGLQRNEFQHSLKRHSLDSFSQGSEVDSVFDLIISFYKSGYDSNIMADYFKNLFFHLFEEYNAQYTFDDKYKRCMETHNPIGNSTVAENMRKVQVHIKRSVTAIRAYTKGLLAGRDAIRSLMWFEPDENCVKELVRMRGCVQCSDNQGSPICSLYCLDILDVCFENHRSFKSAWAMYNNAMHGLERRLAEDFNVDTLINRLFQDINGIMMDFQENGSYITERAISACGEPPHTKPTLRRAKRNLLPQNKRVFEISKVVSDIQKKLDFSFVDLCKDEQVSDLNCWNGTAVVERYTPALFRELEWDTTSPSTVQPDKADLHPDVMYPDAVYPGVIPLRLATKKLRAAIWTKDVDWLDYEHMFFEICRNED